MKIANRVLLTSSAAIALTTAALPHIRGYGTILFQVVVLGAWTIVAHFSSGQFADLHHGFVWSVALLLNLALFLLIVIPIYAFSRKRAPRMGSVLIVVWSMLYIALLFVVFPARDGP
jgi:asparagine N-glycosylation enzyme membrane subunit Stt3